MLAIHVFNRQSKLVILEKSVLPLVSSVLQVENQHFDEASVSFVEIDEISALHKKFFNDPSPTDCISFPIDGKEEKGYRVLGDVFVCPEIAIRYTNECGGNPYKETTLYVVHGVLHLLGYNDIKEEERSLMRKAEKRNMIQLHKQGLYLSSTSHVS